jgi:hypothetical protein
VNSDLHEFERLVAALRPWLPQLVIVGGWAHRLHHEHPQATRPSFQPLRTRDADVAFGTRAALAGRISQALSDAGFREELSSNETPPIAQYFLGADNQGFYAEFLTPLTGDGTRRDGRANTTISRAGISAQQLRHLEVLLIAPWQLPIGGDPSSSLSEPTTLNITNPAAFLAQKLLIHAARMPAKQAQDILYIYDTLQLFGRNWDELAVLWREQVRPKLTPKQLGAIHEMRIRLFTATTDVIRSAARIPVDRTLRPDDVRAVCDLGLATVLADG